MDEMEMDELPEELSNIVLHFMHEIEGFLLLITSDRYHISGTSFDYSILKEMDTFTFTKKNATFSTYVVYDSKSKKIEGDLNLLFEFYLLFINKNESKKMTFVFNYLYKRDGKKLQILPKDLDSEPYLLECEIIPKSKVAVILKKDLDDNILSSFALYKIEKIPNWFILSQDKAMFRPTITRVLSFFNENSIVLDIPMYLFNMMRTENIYPDTPQLEYQEQTEAESIITTLHKGLSSKDYNMFVDFPVITDEICPKCKKRLIWRSGHYGNFLACRNYPECRYVLKK